MAPKPRPTRKPPSKNKGSKGSTSPKVEPQAVEAAAELLSGRVSVRTVAGIGVDTLTRLLNDSLADLRAGKTQRALAQLKVAAALEPNLYMVHQYLGIAASRLNQPRIALQHWQRALSLLEASPELGPEHQQVRQELMLSCAAAELGLDQRTEALNRLRALAAQGDRLDGSLRMTIDSLVSRLSARSSTPQLWS